MRQRLLHVAGRLVRSGRRVALRLPRSWPWAEALVAAFARLRALPVRRARSHQAVSPASTPLAAPADPGLPENGRRRSDSPATDLERSARAAPRNRPGAVTYLKSPALTLRGENGGSRLGDQRELFRKSEERLPDVPANCGGSWQVIALIITLTPPQRVSFGDLRTYGGPGQSTTT